MRIWFLIFPSLKTLVIIQGPVWWYKNGYMEEEKLYHNQHGSVLDSGLISLSSSSLSHALLSDQAQIV